MSKGPVKWSESRSVVSNSFVTPWIVARQAPLSMGVSRQEYWSGLPLHSPGDLPNPGIKPPSPALQADSLPSEPPGTRKFLISGANCKGTRRAEMANWDAEIPHQELLPPVGLEGWRRMHVTTALEPSLCSESQNNGGDTGTLEDAAWSWNKWAEMSSIFPLPTFSSLSLSFFTKTNWKPVGRKP